MDYAMVWSIILTKVALWLKYKVPNKVRLSLNKYNLKSPNFIRTKDRHRITYVLVS